MAINNAELMLARQELHQIRAFCDMMLFDLQLTNKDRPFFYNTQQQFDPALNERIAAVRTFTKAILSTNRPVSVNDAYAFAVLSTLGYEVPSSPPRHVKIQLFGDSTIWGRDGSSIPRSIGAYTIGNSAEKQLAVLMSDLLVSVTTRGEGGTRTAQLLSGTDVVNAGMPWPMPVDAEIVVVNHCINDAIYSLTPANAFTVEDYKQNLRMLRTLTPSGVTFVFQTPNPVSAAPISPATQLIFKDAMLEVAAESATPVIDVHEFVSEIADYETLIPDGIHPIPSLYDRIGRELVAPFLRNLIAV